MQRIGARLGAGFTDGGMHPSFGTRNFVLPLAAGCYLEVVAALDHPAADRAPFGRAVAARTRRRRRLAGLGRARRRHRDRRGSGCTARRRRGTVAAPTASTCAGARSASTTSPRTRSCRSSCSGRATTQHHPAAGGSAIGLRRLEIAGDEPTVDAYLGTPTRQPLDGVEVEWLSPFDGETGVVAAVFDTPHGEVRID